MALYYLYPDGDSGSTTGSWILSAGTTFYNLIDDTQGAPDDNTTYAQGSDAASAIFRCTLAPMVDVVSIASITGRIRVNNAGAGTTQEVRYGLRIGATDYFTGYTTVSSSTYANLSNAWTLNPATSAPWTKPQLDDLIVVVDVRDTVPATDSVRITSYYIEVDYQPIPAGIAVAREIAGQRLRRYRRPLVEPSIEVGLDKLDLELMDDLSLSHFAWPHATGEGAGITNWKRVLLQLRETDVDLNNMVMRLGMRGRRGFLCSFWDTAESRRSSSAAEDGVARLGTGGTITYTRASHAWHEDPGSRLVVQHGINQKPIAYGGMLIENFATNFLQHSSASEGATSLAGLTLAGTGTNGSNITAESSPTQPLFDSSVSNYCYLFTAGNPHAANLTATWPATVSITANTLMRLSIDHVDTASETLTWLLTRAVDGFYWNDSTETWGAGSVANTITSATTRARAYSNTIDVGGTNTTLTLALRIPSGGTASRTHRVYHVQLEDNSWATSRIVTTASTYAREVQSYSITQTAGPRAQNNGGFTFLCEFVPEWNAAEPAALVAFPSFFENTYDADNKWEFYFNGPGASFDFVCTANGTPYLATIAASPVRGTTYKLAARSTTDAGEHDLTPLTISVFVDGVKGTDVVAEKPTESSTTTLYIGGAPSGNACNGSLRRILFTQEVLSDAEIARFAP